MEGIDRCLERFYVRICGGLQDRMMVVGLSNEVLHVRLLRAYARSVEKDRNITLSGRREVH